MKRLSNKYTLYLAYLVALTLLGFLQASCSTDSNAKVGSKEVVEKPDHITLIFQGDIPENVVKVFPTGIKTSSQQYRGEIAYIDSLKKLQVYRFDKEKGEKRLQIPVADLHIAVRHPYQGLDTRYFLFQAGDSVLIKYEGNEPLVSVLNREVPSHEFLVQAKAPLSKLFLNEYSYAVQYKAPPFTYIKDFWEHQDVEGEWERIKEFGVKKARTEYQELLAWVDSLEKEGKLSATTSQFYRDYFFFKLKNAEAITGNYALEEIQQAVRSEDEYLNEYPFYRDFLVAYATHILGADVSYIKTSNSNNPDYRELYNLVKNSREFNADSKRYLQQTFLKMIFTSSSVESAKEYLKAFRSEYPDDAFAQELAVKYNIEDANPQILQLEDSLGSPSSLAQVLERHKGKLVLLDFWASWCAPCIRNFPYSKELSEKYPNLSIIYLSKDEDPVLWKKAMKRFGIADNKSFRITNALTSEWLKQMEVNSIPRYVLYDTEGKMIHRNAPSPGAKSLEELIEEVSI